VLKKPDEEGDPSHTSGVPSSTPTHPPEPPPA